MNTSSLRWGTLSPSRVEAWASLVNHLAQVDQTEETYSAEDLAEELSAPGFDPARDSIAVWDGPEMVAFAKIGVRGQLDDEGMARGDAEGGVAKAWRGEGIGQQIFTWQEQRVREVAAHRHPGAQAYLRVNGLHEGADPRAILARRGYRLVRYFNELGLELSGAPAVVEAQTSAHISIRSLRTDEGEAVRVASNAAFADHWGATSIGSDSWQQMLWGARATRLEHSSVALDERGEILSYVITQEFEPREAYICLVGTVPAARGHGFARATLTHTLRVLAESGQFDRAKLEVDDASPTGATGLYAQLGFQQLRQTATFRLDLS